MQVNIHTPERKPTESQQEYRQRQRLSKESAKLVRLVKVSHAKFGHRHAVKAAGGIRQYKKAKRAVI